MYSPSVVQANDGTWRALWSVGESFPQFAVAYSEDLVTWRPQDYPIVAEKGVKSPVAYQMDDGNLISISRRQRENAMCRLLRISVLLWKIP